MENQIKFINQQQVSLNPSRHYRGGAAILTWADDNKIRIYQLNPQTGQFDSLLLEVLPSQIEKATLVMTTLSLKVAGVIYGMNMSQSANNYIAVGGAVGLGMAKREHNRPELQWWINSLRQQGVDVSVSTFASLKDVLIAIPIIILVMVLVLLTT